MLRLEIQVSDCLAVSALKHASVAAGSKGLGRTVSAISVLETTDVDDIEPSFLTSGELLISTLTSIRYDTGKQCALLYELDKADTSGLILFYVGKILPGLDADFLRIADELAYPIITISPEGPALFTDVIHDIANYIFQRTLNDELSLPELLIDFNASDSQYGDLGLLFNEIGRCYRGLMILLDDKYRLMCCTLNSFLTDTGLSNETLVHNIMHWYRSLYFGKHPASSIMTDQYRHDTGTIFTVNSCQIPLKDTSCRLLFVTEREDISYLFMNMLTQTIRSYILKREDSFHASREDDLLSALFTSNYEYCDYLASKLNISLEQISSMWVICPGADDNAYPDLLLSQRTKTILSYCLKAVADMIRPVHYGFYQGAWILLFDKVLPSSDLSYAASLFLKELNMCFTGSPLFLYDRLSSYKKIAAAYQLIDNIRDIACKVYPYAEYYTLSHIFFLDTCQSCLNHMADSDFPFWPLVLEPLGDDESLISILETMILDTQMDVKKSAELLYLHRNTIYYRLKKIQSILGYDPFSAPGISNISISLALRRILQP